MKLIQDFYTEVKNIQYGWFDKENKLHENLKDFNGNYIMQDIDNIMETNHAICWEMCELQRNFFNKNNIENKTIFAYLKNSKNNACHTFSVINCNDKWYWFEASWANKRGIHEFDSLEDILEYFRNNFTDFSRTEYNPDDLEFYEYNKVNSGVDAVGFFKHCLSSKKIEK